MLTALLSCRYHCRLVPLFLLFALGLSTSAVVDGKKHHHVQLNKNHQDHPHHHHHHDDPTRTTKYRKHRSVLLRKDDVKQEEDVDHESHDHHHRAVQSPSKYCINGFSVYNSSSKSYNPLSIVNAYPNRVLARILLDTYPNKRINIIANPAPCVPEIKCIKLTLGDFQETIQTTEPYALYGDENGTLLTSIPYKSGYQNLSAWSYPTTDCTGDSSGMDTVSVQLVPRTTRGYRYLNLKALYIGTNLTDGSPAPTPADITAFVTATCDFLRLAIRDQLLLRVSISYDQFICQQRFNTGNTSTTGTTTIIAGNVTTNSNGRQPLSITFLIFLKLRVLQNLYDTYGNPDLPTLKTVTDFFYGMLTGTKGIDYQSGLQLSDFIKTRSTVPASNPFYNYTALTLVQ